MIMLREGRRALGAETSVEGTVLWVHIVLSMLQNAPLHPCTHAVACLSIAPGVVILFVRLWNFETVESEIVATRDPFLLALNA